MTLSETCIRSYQAQGDKVLLSDYHCYALAGYYLVCYPGVELEQLQRDMAGDLVRPSVGMSVLCLIHSGIK